MSNVRPDPIVLEIGDQLEISLTVAEFAQLHRWLLHPKELRSDLTFDMSALSQIM